MEAFKCVVLIFDCPGQATTGDTCAVCTHSPLDASSCIPNKSLRLTVKAFIKSEEKKRIKEQKLSVPPTPTEPAPPEQQPVIIPTTSIEPEITTSTEDAVPTEKQVVDTVENPIEPVSQLHITLGAVTDTSARSKILPSIPRLCQAMP